MPGSSCYAVSEQNSNRWVTLGGASIVAGTHQSLTLDPPLRAIELTNTPLVASYMDNYEPALLGEQRAGGACLLAVGWCRTSFNRAKGRVPDGRRRTNGVAGRTPATAAPMIVGLFHEVDEGRAPQAEVERMAAEASSGTCSRTMRVPTWCAITCDHSRSG